MRSGLGLLLASCMVLLLAGPGLAVEVIYECDEPSCGSDEEGTKEAWIGDGNYSGTSLGTMGHCNSNRDDIAGNGGEFDDEGGWSVISSGSDVTQYWSSSNDQDTDAMDLAFFCGHGGTLLGDGYVDMTHVFLGAENQDRLFYYEGEYGDTDLEWVIFDTAYTLTGPAAGDNHDRWFEFAFHFLHLLIGWEDNPANNDSGFQFFDDMMDTGAFDGGGNKIISAWQSDAGGCSGQSNVDQWMLAEHTTHWNDYIHGESTGATDDEPHDTDYYYDPNRC